jgi:hypothetical protein
VVGCAHNFIADVNHAWKPPAGSGIELAMLCAAAAAPPATQTRILLTCDYRTAHTNVFALPWLSRPAAKAKRLTHYG